MSKVLLTIIETILTILHIAFILFVILVPLTNSNYLLFTYSIFIPFMILHWILNDNTCALTYIEQYVRTKITGKPSDKKDCITYKLISPIYDFNKNYNSFSTFIYIITIY